MQADVAVNSDIIKGLFDFAELKDPADILIFPELNASNIAYKLLAQLSEATPIGPVLIPMKDAANIVQRTATVDEIVNMSHLTAVMGTKGQ